MRWLTILYLAIGVALLGVVLWQTDVGKVAAQVTQIGWQGALAVLAVYFVVFLIDSTTWLLALPSVRFGARALARMWRVRLVGEAFNSVMPAAGLGGEPVKAVLLKSRYDIGYHQAAASIVLGRTINMLALTVFLATAFAVMAASPSLSAAFRGAGLAGLVVFLAATALLLAVQWFRLPSRAGGWLQRWHGGQRLAGALVHIREVEDLFLQFYGRHRARLLGGVALAVVQWFVGALEVYVALAFLGHPVALHDAVMIEAVTQLVRAGAFFIPANLGAQEGAFVVMCAAITGSPSLGLSVAVVRRFRELVYILLGFGQGLLFSLAERKGGSGALRP
jgi:uncharacterized protein (TIRG00374 family)